MRAVNLLPRDAQMRKSIRDEDPAVVVGSAFAVVVVIALGAGFVTAHSRATSEQQKLAAARSELGRLSAELKPVKPVSPTKSSKPARPVIAVPAVTAEEQPRLDALASALSSRIAWDRVLREFSLVVPSDVSVSSLSMTAPAAPSTTTSSTAASTNGFALAGVAWSHDSVARLLARLMLIPDLSDVTLASSVADAKTGRVTFTINAAVKGAVVAPPAAAAATTPATGSGATS